MRVCTTTPTGVANGLLVKARDCQLKISGPSPTYHWLSCSVVFSFISDLHARVLHTGACTPLLRRGCKAVGPGDLVK